MLRYTSVWGPFKKCLAAITHGYVIAVERIYTVPVSKMLPKLFRSVKAKSQYNYLTWSSRYYLNSRKSPMPHVMHLLIMFPLFAEHCQSIPYFLSGKIPFRNVTLQISNFISVFSPYGVMLILSPCSFQINKIKQQQQRNRFKIKILIAKEIILLYRELSLLTHGVGGQIANY